MRKNPRSDLVDIIQRCCSGGIVTSWYFLPRLVDAILEYIEENYKLKNKEAK